MMRVSEIVGSDLSATARSTVRADALSTQRYDMAVQSAIGSKVINGQGVEGSVIVAFSLTAMGELVGARVMQSSGSQRLDAAALARVTAASFPPPTGPGLRLSHVSKFTFR
jgi:protein TonB